MDVKSSGTDAIDLDDARREIAGGDALAVDVRSKEEWSQGHVPGAIHLPDGEGERPEEGTRLIVVAGDGKEAARAAGRLSDEGYDASALDGGMDDWKKKFSIQ